MILPMLALFSFRQGDHSLDPAILLFDPLTHKQTAIIRQSADRLSRPEMSPKMFGSPPSRWRFDWQTVAYESLIPSSKEFARFSVFSQERNPTDDTAVGVARMLERLWEFNYLHLKIDHSQAFGQGVVEVFLCNGGIPGGEQLFDEDSVNSRTPVKVNTIYLYDVGTFRNPIEMAREVAHEYGHATLPPVGGYQAPEDWANGYLGEKLFLRHVADGLDTGKLEPADVMGATASDVRKWVTARVDPLIIRAAERGPDMPGLRGRSSAGMDNFIGFALYMDAIMPETIFSRSLQLIPSTNAEDYPEAVSIACEEHDSYTLKVPQMLKGRSLWIPLTGRVRGAKVLKRKAQWANILPSEQNVVVELRHS